MSKSNYRFPYYGNTGQEKAEADAAKDLFDDGVITPPPSTELLIYFGSNSNVLYSQSHVMSLQNSRRQEDMYTIYETSAIGYKYVAFPIEFGMPSRLVDIRTGFDVATDESYPVVVNFVDGGVNSQYYLFKSKWQMQDGINIEFV